MKNKPIQNGVSLTETVVVVAVIALLAALGLPAVSYLTSMGSSTGSTESSVSAALAAARAMALEQNRYVGVRFQTQYKEVSGTDNPFNDGQYMIFVGHTVVNNQSVFTALDGVNPVKLPDNIGVMDLYAGGTAIIGNSNINNTNLLRDACAFTVLFSPSGKLVIKNIRMCNRNGAVNPTTAADSRYDSVFNSPVNISGGTGMFVQDDQPGLGYAPEDSRAGFVIYERDKFKTAYENNRPYNDCIKDLIDNHAININFFSGRIISDK